MLTYVTEELDSNNSQQPAGVFWDVDAGQAPAHSDRSFFFGPTAPAKVVRTFQQCMDWIQPTRLIKPRN